MCGQVSIGWGSNEEIVLRGGSKAEGWFNGFLLQTTSKVSKAFLFSVVFFSFVDQFKTDSLDFNFEMQTLLKAAWKLKLPEALVLLVPLWASEFSSSAFPLFEPTLEHAGSTAWNAVGHNESVALDKSFGKQNNKYIGTSKQDKHTCPTSPKWEISLCLIHSRCHTCRSSIFDEFKQLYSF